MVDWQRILVGKAIVRGVNEQYSGLLDVDVSLEPAPDIHWAAVFERGPSDHSISVSMHPPHLHGTPVRIRPPDDEVERYMEALRARVEATNSQYEREILPALRGEQQAAEDAEAERRHRAEDAQRRLDELS